MEKPRLIAINCVFSFTHKTMRFFLLCCIDLNLQNEEKFLPCLLVSHDKNKIEKNKDFHIRCTNIFL